MWAHWLHHHLMHITGFFSNVNSLTASPLDASPRFLWFHWFHHHLMHLLGFVISFTASPPNASLGFLWSHWLHHHLMHFLGFLISFTASPPNASPRFLWSHWLHHHLMFHYYTFLYVGMLAPPNKCKGKEERGNEVYNIWISSWPKGTTPMMLVGISCVCWKFILYNL